MPRIAKVMTPEEYQEAQERSAWIRKALRVQGIPAYILAAAIQKNPNTLHRWLRTGLTEDQFDLLRDRVTRISLFRLADGGEGRE